MFPQGSLTFSWRSGVVAGLGLVLLFGLLAWQGFSDVAQLLLASGWNLLLLPLVWFPTLILATQGWRQLFRPAERPPFSDSLLAQWMGRAVNNLLPVATIGGEVVKARLLILWGAGGVPAAASVMVDKVVQALALAGWALVGALLLLLLPEDNGLFPYIFGGIVLLLCGAGIFVFLQRLGLLGALARYGSALLKHELRHSISGSAAAVDQLVRTLYSRHGSILAATLYRFAHLALHTLELWLACQLLGQPLGLGEALLLRSLTAALSDLAFMVPNAYGVQEGAFIVIGALLGLEPGFCLALSLALRVRDLIFDPVGLLALQQVESHRYLQRRGAARSSL